MKIWNPFKSKTIKNRGMIAKSISNAGFSALDFSNYIENGFFNITNENAYQIYDRSGPVSAAIGRISCGLAQLIPEIVDREGMVIKNHPMLDILRRPGFGQSYKTVMTNAAVAHLLTGDAYFMTDMRRTTLRSPKPFNVDIRQSMSDGFAENYRVQIQGVGTSSDFMRDGKFNFIDPVKNELAHVISETMVDCVNGRTLLSAIFTDIGQNIEGGKHNLSLLKNGLRTSTAFMFDDSVEETQLDFFKDELQGEKAGSENAGSSLIVPWGGEIKELSQTNRDMDYKNVIELAAKSIAIAYKVPLPLIVSEKQTLDNFSQATLALYDDAIFPLTELLFEKLTQLMQLPDNQKISFNPSQVPAVRMRRFKEAAIKSDSGKFTIDEIRQDFGGAPLKGKGGDQLLVPVNLIPLEDVGLDVDPKVDAV